MAIDITRWYTHQHAHTHTHTRTHAHRHTHSHPPLLTPSYLNFGLAFCNEDFELFAIGVYAKLFGKEAAKDFQVSNGAITRYKQQWGFGSKRPRISHVAKNPDLAEQMVAYRAECKEWLEIVGPRNFLNFDETF